MSSIAVTVAFWRFMLTIIKPFLVMFYFPNYVQNKTFYMPRKMENPSTGIKNNDKQKHKTIPYLQRRGS